jgi:hypothetical protein
MGKLFLINKINKLIFKIKKKKKKNYKLFIIIKKNKKTFEKK